MKFCKFSLVLSAVALFVFACAENKPANSNAVNANQPIANQNAKTESAPSPAAATFDLAATKKVYATSCANCHKQDGTGGKVTIEGKTINAENLTTDKMKKMPDAKYVEIIEEGIDDEGMPSFKGRLSDEQIKNLVTYIRQEFQK